jgi:hypothetical protein
MVQELGSLPAFALLQRSLGGGPMAYLPSVSEVGCTPMLAQHATRSKRAGRLALLFLGVMAVAMGWSGTALGERWTVQPAAGPSGASEAALASVSCVSATSCLAVGSDSNGYNPQGTEVVDPGAFAEQLQGASWAPTAVEQPPAGSPSLDSVSCASPEFCIAVGAATISQPETVSVAAPLAETWNGVTWQIQAPVGAYAGRLTGVSCLSSSFCMAVGHFNAADGPTSLVERALVETWDGERWQIVPAAPLPGVQYSALNSVSCVQPNACTAVGGYYPGGASTLSFDQEVPLAESWDGARWVRDALPSPTDRQVMWENQYVAFRAVSCTASDVCLAGGTGHDENGPGKLFAATLRRGRWTRTTRLGGVLDGGEISGVSCLSVSRCVVVGALFPHAFEDARGDFHLTWKVEPLAYDWNGRSWSRDAVGVGSGSSRSSSSITLSAPALGDVSCVTSGPCAAVGARRAGSNSAVLTALAPYG